jgi:hypothetical protein
MKLLRKKSSGKIIDLMSGEALSLNQQIELIQSGIEFRIEDECSVDCMREFVIEVLIRSELIAVSVSTNDLLSLVRNGDGSLSNAALCVENDMLESCPRNRLAA